MTLILFVAGLGLLITGAETLVRSSSRLAAVGLSPLVIGLTIITIGTSLPEIATSIIASVRGARDIAVGNVIGSNIFNITSAHGGYDNHFGRAGGARQAPRRHDPKDVTPRLAQLPITVNSE